MGQYDIREKLLEEYNDVFVDIFNVLMFQGEVLECEKLKDGSTESIYKAVNGDYREQRRDVLKTYLDSCQMAIAFLGVENQTNIDKYIPIRIMGYDYTKYRSQIDEDKFPLLPTITIVLNFSNKQWENCKKLSDIVNIPIEFEPYVQDYEVRVFDIAFLDDEVIDQFKSDFRLVARFFKNRRLGMNPLSDTTEIQHLTELIDFLTVFTNDARYGQTKSRLEELKKKGVKVSMCWVAQELWEKGEAVGENKLAKLMNYLLTRGLTEEAQKAASDEIARKEMYLRYGIKD